MARRVSALSWWLGMALCSLALLQVLPLQGTVADAMSAWLPVARQPRVQQAAGYTMLLCLALLSLTQPLLRLLGRPRAVRALHQCLAVVLVLGLLVHASRSRSGHLLVLSLLLLATCLLGAGLAWMQDHSRTAGRIGVAQWHLAAGLCAAAWALVHVYLVYAYAG